MVITSRKDLITVSHTTTAPANTAPANTTAAGGLKEAVALALAERLAVVQQWPTELRIERDLPGVGKVGFYLWSGSTGIYDIDVVDFEGQVLDELVSFELTAHNRIALQTVTSPVVITADDVKAMLCDTRPAVVRMGRVVWTLVTGTEDHKEVVALNTNGQPVWETVNTRRAPYRMNCARCGRARYARRAAVDRVILCRVCGDRRAAQRHIAQNYMYRARKRGKSAKIQTVVTPDLRKDMAQKRQKGWSMRKLAAHFGVSVSTVARHVRKTSASA